MKSERGSRHLIFKTCIAVGFALGIVLLWQTISTYIYVSGNMMTQAAQRDADQKRASLQRAIRPGISGSHESPNLESVLNDSIEEWKDQVAWIRILNAEGMVVADAGKVPESSAIALSNREPEIRKTPLGDALVATYPYNVGRSRGVKLEVAVYLNSVSASFASLRQNLITGVSASLALMGALILLVLRFPKYLQGQQVQGQVELARRVQADMLPERDSRLPNFDFAAECIPAGEVGGDFCDMFKIGDDRTAFILGDVSGKGISAALLMALINGAIQSMSWTRSSEDHENATRSLNALLCRKTATERFSTLFWGYFDPKTSTLRYINAGHLPPLLIRTGEFGNLEVKRLETGGPVLGLIPDAPFSQGELAIRKGDVLVAFSDGIVEAPNFNSEEFGERRLIDAIRDGWNDSAGGIRNSVLSRVRAYMNDGQAVDDQTLMVVRFKDPTAKELPHMKEEAVAKVGGLARRLRKTLIYPLPSMQASGPRHLDGSTSSARQETPSDCQVTA
jgi:serine phosphatase RsbU (regulator of sigma subunit)